MLTKHIDGDAPKKLTRDWHVGLDNQLGFNSLKFLLFDIYERLFESNFNLVSLFFFTSIHLLFIKHRCSF